ncbi:MAG TPA: PIG-L family deacetylase [Terriglobia bacterium]|nr:PIG-L family deacetylase [Terriglobia bacterium]
MRVQCLLFLIAVISMGSPVFSAVTVHGAAVKTGYNTGSKAVIRAKLSGAAEPNSYSVVATVQYAGANSSTEVPLRQQAGRGPEPVYHGEWLVPVNARTGLYHLSLRVDDQRLHKSVASSDAPGFFVYRKLLRITHVTLDKEFYAPGERIRCEMGIENLTGSDLKGLRVEFSNENYPWISTFSGQENAAGRMAANPSLGLVVLRASLDIPAHRTVTLPMEAAGVAAFLQGSEVAVMGAGGPARHEKVPSPEVDRYTIAVWDQGRQNLLDMQFSHEAIVREPGRVLPKPYSRNYTHPYNDEIDFTKYREFYPPGFISPAISLDRSHTLYRPGDLVTVNATVKQLWPGFRGLDVAIRDPQGKEVWSGMASEGVTPVATTKKTLRAWKIPLSAEPGVYTLTVSERTAKGKRANPAKGKDLGAAQMEIAINKLPSSLMVFCPHEDDEHPWAGLIRAMLEARLPVHVVFYTGGDVGECERYFGGQPCDPVRAREFGTVRMEESREALEHLGLPRSEATFLGLPDGGSGEIWFRHIHVANPFFSIYLAVDHAPYEAIFEQNLPYARDAVIAAAKRLIERYHPAMIATPHPDERHVDHRTANWFTVKACQELLKEGKLGRSTTILADRAYGSGGYKPAPYHYARYVVYLSGEAAVLKQEMGWIYQSQDGNLDEGSKKTFEELPRQGLHERILDWQEHAGWNE